MTAAARARSALDSTLGSTVGTAVDRLRRVGRREADAYRQGEDRPLAGHLGTMAVYASSVAALVGAGDRIG